MIVLIIGTCAVVAGAAVGVQLPEHPSSQQVALARVTILGGLALVFTAGAALLVGGSA